MDFIYFDNSATTSVDKRVAEEMNKFLMDNYANSSSKHSYGEYIVERIEEMRLSVAKHIGAEKKEEIIFTGSGTESDNIALASTAKSFAKKGKHIVVSSIEHSAIIETAKYLESIGFEVTYLPALPNGLVDVDAFKKAIRKDTILASIMLVNNETGVINPIKEMASYARENNLLFHTDAVQGLGKIEVDVQKLNVDMLTFSGHKIHGPKGIGVLYVKDSVRKVLKPVTFGGKHEGGLRPGTLANHQIAGLSMATELAVNELEQNARYIASLRDSFEEKLLESLDEIVINGKDAPRVCSVSNITFKYVDSEAIQLMINNICCTPGSACTGSAVSHVLEAMDVNAIDIRSTLRFSFSKSNTMEEVDIAVESLSKGVKQLRVNSPLYNKK